MGNRSSKEEKKELEKVKPKPKPKEKRKEKEAEKEEEEEEKAEVVVDDVVIENEIDDEDIYGNKDGDSETPVTISHHHQAEPGHMVRVPTVPPIGVPEVPDVPEKGDSDFEASTSVGGGRRRGGSISEDDHFTGLGPNAAARNRHEKGQASIQALVTSLSTGVVEEEKVRGIEEDHIDSVMEDATSTFLHLLNLEVMSEHLKAMRDRRMFLEIASQNDQLPESERDVINYLLDTYLRKPTAMPEQTQSTSSPRRTSSKASAKSGFKSPTSTAVETVSMIESTLLKSEVSLMLAEEINTWEFDVFKFDRLCGSSSLKHSLPAIMLSICDNRDLIDNKSYSFKIPKIELTNFMLDIANSYKDNPYHNHIHACDVTVSMNYFMLSSIFDRIDAFDKFSILIAASIHDVGHPGHNNLFEINTESELAITYNDKSVLENFHIALAWRVLQKDDNNFIRHLTQSQRRRFREVLITAVLATDMSEHAVHSANLDELVTEKQENNANAGAAPSWDYGTFSRKFLPVALHTADLGNPAKPLNLCEEWVERRMGEFFHQGDEEKARGLPISNLCDRTKVNVAAGQVGFINYVIEPWFTRWGELLDEMNQGPLFLKIMRENKSAWQTKADLVKDLVGSTATSSAPSTQPSTPVKVAPISMEAGMISGRDGGIHGSVNPSSPQTPVILTPIVEDTGRPMVLPVPDADASGELSTSLTADHDHDHDNDDQDESDQKREDDDKIMPLPDFLPQVSLSHTSTGTSDGGAGAERTGPGGHRLSAPYSILKASMKEIRSGLATGLADKYNKEENESKQLDSQTIAVRLAHQFKS